MNNGEPPPSPKALTPDLIKRYEDRGVVLLESEEEEAISALWLASLRGREGGVESDNFYVKAWCEHFDKEPLAILGILQAMNHEAYRTLIQKRERNEWSENLP